MRFCFGMALLLSVALARTASAGDPPASAARTPTKQEQAEAGKKFKEGERAFAKHDYKAAAVAFEAAYAIAPHPDVLLNAVDARDRAGDLVIAARHCARLIKEFPEHKSVAEARAHLAQLTPKIGRAELAAKGGGSDLRLDGEPVEPGEVFVDPGDHVLRATFGSEAVEKPFSVAAGVRVNVLVEAPPPLREDGTREPPPGTPGPAPVATSTMPLHPAIFGVALGLTAVSGGVLIWSGIDTNRARKDFDANPTQAGLDEGEGKQLRTNIFVGVTAGLAAITVPVAIFTNWGGSGAEKPVALRVGPSGFAVAGSF